MMLSADSLTRSKIYFAKAWRRDNMLHKEGRVRGRRLGLKRITMDLKRLQ